jgi:hypothetical protein
MKLHQRFDSVLLIFELLGILSIVLGVAAGVLGYASWRHPGGHDTSLLVFAPLCFIPVGVGLMFQRRIAAILLSVPSGVLAVHLIIGSIAYVPFPSVLLGILFGFLFLFPCWATWRGWGILR